MDKKQIKELRDDIAFQLITFDDIIRDLKFRKDLSNYYEKFYNWRLEVLLYSKVMKFEKAFNLLNEMVEYLLKEDVIHKVYTD